MTPADIPTHRDPEPTADSVAITEDAVRYVANLARLRLSESEVGLFTQQLQAVLGYAAELNQLDLAEVAPLTHPLAVINALRADEVSPSLDRDVVLAQAPAHSEGAFRIPAVLKRDSK